MSTINEVTLIIPGYNNLKHLKNAYKSIRKWYPDIPVILIDDGSTDGTAEFCKEMHDRDNTDYYVDNKRRGHTIQYDRGISRAETSIVGILHADMIVGPNYIENCIKHIEPGKVVCGTRVEPPLHPPGIEKVILNFGLDFNDLDTEGFYEWVINTQEKRKELLDPQTTRGMFAPWFIYKKDFEAIGGHDPRFAPFPYEDSDIFQRWILKGYELIQSREAYVYHLTCRGHRWTEQIQKDGDEFKVFETRARKEYIKKWKSWIKNDEYHHPIVPPVYTRAISVPMETPRYLLEWLEVYFDLVIVRNNTMSSYGPLNKNVNFMVENVSALNGLMSMMNYFNFDIKEQLGEEELQTNTFELFPGVILTIEGSRLVDRAKELIYVKKDTGTYA